MRPTINARSRPVNWPDHPGHWRCARRCQGRTAVQNAAASAGVGSAAFDLAEGYTTGWAGERSTTVACELGPDGPLPSASRRLGSNSAAHIGGFGVERDSSEALTWYQLAANNNIPAAQLRLGDIARYGQLDQPRNERVALRWYRLAADHGEARAGRENSKLYWEGSDDLPRDRAAAVHHYVVAANQAIASAERKLAIAYANGDGAPADDRQMLHWERKAAEGGDAVAAAMLGYAIMIGIDGTYDLVESATWLGFSGRRTHAARNMA